MLAGEVGLLDDGNKTVGEVFENIKTIFSKTNDNVGSGVRIGGEVEQIKVDKISSYLNNTISDDILIKNGDIDLYNIKVINEETINMIDFHKICIDENDLAKKIIEKERKQLHIFSKDHILGKSNNGVGFGKLANDLNMSEKEMEEYVINYIVSILKDIDNEIGFPIGKSTQIRTKINGYDLEIRFYLIPPNGTIGNEDAFLGYGGELKNTLLIEKY